ncbi:unnamed protein product [Thelazia callipaeda]|uniref:B3_4 domain-containing protein n=1 Tax=Thelazia callipaeda TaxID=103827 RepID=A0A0N5D9V7_THECL|nr:unnamed protein product [Thelazia callipaeda]
MKNYPGILSPDSRLLMKWPEISLVAREKRCELTLNSIPVHNRKPSINDEELQNQIFAVNKSLNYIELAGLNITLLHQCIGKASKLKKLILYNNSLTHIPEEIGGLKELVFLDISMNKIEELPNTLGTLSCLTTLLLANNNITSLPDISGLVSLQHLDVSHNQLTDFPTLFCYQSKLQTLILNSNKIKSIPSEIDALSGILKTIDVSDNEITDLPFVFCNFSKLKTLNLTNNKFSDQRFNKLVQSPRHKTSMLIEYLKKRAPNKCAENKKLPLGTDVTAANDSASDSRIITIDVQLTKEVAEIRPYIASCIFKNCSLTAEKIKHLLNIQNKLHSTICCDRTIASIGTHDCSNIQPPLTYAAVNPDLLMITPIHHHKKISGREFVSTLGNEAELSRELVKRNVVSDIYKYIYLIQRLPLYPCLIDAKDLVISLPPVTNCDETKLQEDTKDIFVEVTSTASESKCVEIMDLFVKEVVEQKCLTNLIIEQIKITKDTGSLLVAYPSKNNLQLSGITIKREKTIVEV